MLSGMAMLSAVLAFDLLGDGGRNIFNACGTERLPDDGLKIIA
jgi:hypothetical protein